MASPLMGRNDLSQYGGYAITASGAYLASASMSLQGLSACGVIAHPSDLYFIKSDPDRYIRPNPEPDLDSLATKLVDRILNFAVIVPCAYCDSANAFTNPTCVQCGAPLGHNRQPKSKFG